MYLGKIFSLCTWFDVYRLNKKYVETVDLTFDNVKTLDLIFNCLQVMHTLD